MSKRPTEAPIGPALLALSMAHSGDLDPGRVRAEASRYGRDVLLTLSICRAHLLGLLDVNPGDAEILLALGMVASATPWRSVSSRWTDDDEDDETVVELPVRAAL